MFIHNLVLVFLDRAQNLNGQTQNQLLEIVHVVDISQLPYIDFFNFHLLLKYI